MNKNQKLSKKCWASFSEVIFSKQSIPVSQSIPEQFLYGYFPKHLATEFEYSHDEFCRASKIIKIFLY